MAEPAALADFADAVRWEAMVNPLGLLVGLPGVRRSGVPARN